MTLKSDLENFLGQENVSSETEIIKKYSCDQSFVQPRSPDIVAFPQNVEQVQEIVKYANSTNTPVVPFSSGLNFHGAAIPKEGGILMDLSKMNKILEIEENNWHCVIEPGVTARQLQDELEKHQLKAMLPAGIHPERSVMTSLLERDPSMASASFEFGNELIMDTELVLPTGELFRTGLWSSGVKPGSPMGPVRAMINRLWTAAQGTLGIMTKMNIKVEYLPEKRKIFMIPFDSFPDAMPTLKAVQRKEIGHECFLMNNFNIASMACKDWKVPESFPAEAISSKEFEALRESLPEWLLVICSNGGPRQPEGKIAYEEETLQEICSIGQLQTYDNPLLAELFSEETLRPWSILKKFCYKGSVHDLSFKTTLKRFPDFQHIFMEMINRYNYPLRDVGIFILPLERGRAYHCIADLHCNHDDAPETAIVKNLWLEASERLIDEGALFDRPYGAWADMVYSRAGTYTQKLKEIKKEIDPNNILNPGHLCF